MPPGNTCISLQTCTAPCTHPGKYYHFCHFLEFDGAGFGSLPCEGLKEGPEVEASIGSEVRTNENPARYGDWGSSDFKSTLCWNRKKNKVEPSTIIV